MGHSGLASILRQAGLQRYSGPAPPANEAPGMPASDYAAIMQVIENYYGRGARGVLLRVGVAAFQALLTIRRVKAASLRLVLRSMRLQQRRLLALRWLAREMGGPGGRISVHLDNDDLTFLDHDSDATTGRKRDAEICWVTVGQIQEALRWATGMEHEVIQASCRAKGDPACIFRIRNPVR
jgi:predicted hydrocarbon binding protein